MLRREQLALVMETTVGMAKTVNATAEAVTELNGRVEKHTGPVEAWLFRPPRPPRLVECTRT